MNDGQNSYGNKGGPPPPPPPRSGNPYAAGPNQPAGGPTGPMPGAMPRPGTGGAMVPISSMGGYRTNQTGPFMPPGYGPPRPTGPYGPMGGEYPAPESYADTRRISMGTVVLVSFLVSVATAVVIFLLLQSFSGGAKAPGAASGQAVSPAPVMAQLDAPTPD